MLFETFLCKKNYWNVIQSKNCSTFIRHQNSCFLIIIWKNYVYIYNAINIVFLLTMNKGAFEE